MSVARSTLALCLRVSYFTLVEPVNSDARWLGIEPIVVVCIEALEGPIVSFTSIIALCTRVRSMSQLSDFMQVLLSVLAFIHSEPILSHELLHGQISIGIHSHLEAKITLCIVRFNHS